MKLGAAKQFIEPDWKRRWAYALLGEIHVPGWIRLQHVIRALDKLPLQGRAVRFLDAGSGRGDLIAYLAERHPSWSFVGVELEPDRIAKAEKIRDHLGLKNICYRSGNICDLTFKDEFDVAVCLDVLEHVADDRRALSNLICALKPGGYLLLTSPAIPQPAHLPLVAWRERRIGFDMSEYGHVRQGYSREDVQQLCLDAGSRSVSTRYTFGKAGTLAFDLFFSIGDNRPNPLLFAVMYAPLKLLAWADLHDTPQHGAALLAVATKAF